MTFFATWGSERKVDTKIIAVLFTPPTTLKVRSRSVTKFPFVNSSFCSFGGMLMNGKILIGAGRNVYEYILSEDKWIHAQYIEHSRDRAEGCAVNNNYLLCGGNLRTRVELLRFKQEVSISYNDDRTEEDTSSLENTAQNPATSNTTTNVDNNFFHTLLGCIGLGRRSVDTDNSHYLPSGRTTSDCKKNREEGQSPHLNDTDCQHFGSKCKLPHIFCPTPLPLHLTGGHTVTNIKDNQVILIGGYCGGSASSSVFIGELTDNESDVTWIEQESLNKARQYHMTFKMDGNVFVAGGVDKDYKALYDCERFSINRNTWVRNQHHLPYPLVNATVIVSTDETFAVITGGWKDLSNDTFEGSARILSYETLIFTIDGGFKRWRLPQDDQIPSLKGRDAIFRVY